MSVSILIADDHGLLRAGLRSLLSSQPDMRVVGEAADGDAALQLANELQPDVVLADISMPGPNGIQVAEQLRKHLPQIRVLILTMHEDRGLVQAALKAGANGYIAKRAVESDLVTAIRTVARGDTYVQPAVFGTPLALVDHHAGPALAELDEAELEMLRLMARSRTNAQIATALRIGVTVVQSRRQKLMAKLGLRGRVDLMRFARDQDLL